MKKSFVSLSLCIGVLAICGAAFAGGKRDGASCHVSKSCRSGLCVTIPATDKFGHCCTQQDCAALSKQCGETTDNCGLPLSCGSCDPGSSCVDNQCVLGTTTTTTSTTTTSSTTTSSTTSTSTTTTTAPPTQCDIATACNQEIGCGGGCDSWVNADASACFCGAGDSPCNAHSACGIGNSCPSGFTCVNNCCGLVCWENCVTGSTTTTSTTTTTTSTTTTTTLGCIPQNNDCNVGDPNCCNGLQCLNNETGSTGFQCLDCVPLFGSCTPGGFPCCTGSCQSQESVTTCLP